MPTEAKQAAVAKLKEELSNSKATIVADYRGLTVSDISAVRRSLRSEGITYHVVKNRLAKIAATEAGRGELNELLEGPSALAIGSADEVTLARVFLDAVRPYKTVVVRGGMIGEKRIDAGSVTRLASLPSREALLAQLAGGMASPLAAMASLFAAPLRNLGYALSQLVEQKGPPPGAAADAAAPAAVKAEAPKAEAQAAEALEAVAEAEATVADVDAEAPEAEVEAEAPAAAAEAEAEAPAAAAEAEAEAPAAAAEVEAEAPAAAAEAEAEAPAAAAESEPEAPAAEVPDAEAEAEAEAPAAEPTDKPKSE